MEDCSTMGAETNRGEEKKSSKKVESVANLRVTCLEPRSIHFLTIFKQFNDIICIIVIEITEKTRKNLIAQGIM